MFWGLSIHSGFQYCQSVQHSYHVSKATLEVPIEHELALTGRNIATAMVSSSGVNTTTSVERATDATETRSPSNRVQLWMKHNEQHYLLCQLDAKRNVQVDLNLNFSFGEQITYYLSGSGVVHLTGYMLEPDTALTDDEDDELEVEDDEPDQDDTNREWVNYGTGQAGQDDYSVNGNGGDNTGQVVNIGDTITVQFTIGSN